MLLRYPSLRMTSTKFIKRNIYLSLYYYLMRVAFRINYIFSSPVYDFSQVFSPHLFSITATVSLAMSANKSWRYDHVEL